MKKPPFVTPTDEITTIGHVFGTPLVVKGYTWLPLIELIAWPVMTWIAGRRHPDWSWPKRATVGAVTTVVALGSEWCHNFAHAAAARWVGKPMDAMRIFWGTPLCIYYDIEDNAVAPRQHIARALGGPIINAVLMSLARLLRPLTRQGTASREIADTAVAMNTFLATVSLTPIPGIDGGPILKWSLVDRGKSPAEADAVVQKVNGVMGAGLMGVSAVALKKRRWLLGVLAALFGVISLLIGLGLLKEK